ncbi:MAG: phenylalanine--tRNA ligase beta subunit-related protein, partial [Rhodothermales bacterium]|nr:phenylalanine--tRNA ligase beta subunit-related protein [Rhodothermales bacterium]
YKPTGRGKPASEYLLRAAADESGFPRINWPVDVCNYISLSSLLPISIWDLDMTSGERFQFRLGKPDEKYTFNAAGQEISLEDLAVGCEGGGSALGSPIVNPIKDSMQTKTTDDTRRVMACVYAPAEYPESELENWCRTFQSLLEQGAVAPVHSRIAVVQPGATGTC